MGGRLATEGVVEEELLERREGWKVVVLVSVAD